MRFKNLKTNEVLSEQQFYKVVKTSGDKVQLKNDNGEMIVVDSNYVEKCLTSATQYTSEKTVNKTEAAAIFMVQAGVAILHSTCRYRDW